MFAVCLICHRSNSFPLAHCFICRMCMNVLSPVTEHRWVHSLYEYNGPMRDLILRAKIAGERPVIKSLLSLMRTAPQVEFLTSSCRKVMPAPSSFWGRLRGQTDLAWFLAKEISLLYEIPFENPPVSLLWRMKKRARILNKKRVVLKSRRKENKFLPETLLIVDDVVTTGDTMSRLSALYNDVYRIEFLALARASRHF